MVADGKLARPHIPEVKGALLVGVNSRALLGKKHFQVHHEVSEPTGVDATESDGSQGANGPQHEHEADPQRNQCQTQPALRNPKQTPHAETRTRCAAGLHLHTV